MERLFIYGTLRIQNLRKKLTGREITSFGTDSLSGFRLSKIYSEGQYYPIIIDDSSSKQIIEGEIIEVTVSELKKLDCYEGSFYKRRKVVLNSGIVAWAYTQ
ncbi:MAG: gamma-glutamylcyclotransferase [Bacteroidales bacterium]|nr:gamma-glutamylcyclotransferase [Bacteroidales bacterium]